MGILRTIRPAIVVALACLIGGMLQAGNAIPWVTDTTGAIRTAADSGKPVFVDLWAVWCEPCKIMEETTYRDPRVIEAMNGFVPLKLDADSNEIFQERYEIGGLPTTVFLDGRGREISRLVSLVDADALLESMSSITEGYSSYMENVGNSGDSQALRDAAGYLMQAGNPIGAADKLRDALKLSKTDDAVAEVIELELADALIGAERVGAALKVLRRLSAPPASDQTRGQALVALVRAEREHGKPARADEALARLREEFPDLAPSAE